LTVSQEGRTLEATGIDSDQDPAEAWDAEFCDDGWVYIAGRHRIRNDRVLLTGVFYLEFERRGERMTGFYLQNETDHGSRIVLGRLTLTLLERHHPPA
jgi:hypothetical protein